MKEFEVTITETLQKSVVVEADSKDDAIQMVEDMWKDADIILDSENFVGVEYESDNGKEIEKSFGCLSQRTHEPFYLCFGYTRGGNFNGHDFG